MSDSEGFDENSYESYDTENVILEELTDKFNCLKPYQFEPEKELVKDTDESEEECSEESDGESQSQRVKERTGNTTWCECCKCKAEKREIDCLYCQEVASNKKFDKLAVKCITETEEFRTLCINKAVLDTVLTGLHDSRGDYLEKITSN